MLFARVEFHAIREDIPETYCGLACPDDLLVNAENGGELKGAFCVRCAIIIGHHWAAEGTADPKVVDGYRCTRCGTSSRVATSGKIDRCPVRPDRVVLADPKEQAVIPKEKKEQWETQIARLDGMIEGATNDVEKERYTAWKAELQARLDGKPLPTEKRSSGGDEAYDRRSARVLEWLKSRSGEKVSWAEFVKGAKTTSGKLGKIVGRMIQEGRLKEDPQYCYHVLEGGDNEQPAQEDEAVEPAADKSTEEPAVETPEAGEDSKAADPETVEEPKKAKPAKAKGGDQLALLEECSLFGD